MRPVDIYLNALGFSPWVPIDYLQTSFGIGMGFDVSSGATLTATAQYTFDDINQNNHPVQVSQAGTVLTVTDTGFTQSYSNTNGLGGHNLSVGDWVSLESTQFGADGQYAVATVLNNTSYTLTSAVSQTAASSGNAQAASARVYNHPTLTGVSTRSAANFQFPVMAVRLLITAYTSGTASLAIRQGMGSR